MNRPALLNDQEYQIIDLIRKSHEQIAQKTSTSWRGEIEAAYNELQYIDGSTWEETVHAVRDRLYGILY